MSRSCVPRDRGGNAGAPRLSRPDAYLLTSSSLRRLTSGPGWLKGAARQTGLLSDHWRRAGVSFGGPACSLSEWVGTFLLGSCRICQDHYLAQRYGASITTVNVGGGAGWSTARTTSKRQVPRRANPFIRAGGSVSTAPGPGAAVSRLPACRSPRWAVRPP